MSFIKTRILAQNSVSVDFDRLRSSSFSVLKTNRPGPFPLFGSYTMSGKDGKCGDYVRDIVSFLYVLPMRTLGNMKEWIDIRKVRERD